MDNKTAADIPVICLMGTTATGKTDAAAALTDQVDAEIISVDSSLVYRGMNIGTAKPSKDFLDHYPHHLVDIRDPDDTYSVADFYRDCMMLIKQITAAGRVPVLAGGTHFYYSAIERGISVLPQADIHLRAEIAADAAQYGWPKMHARLAVLDAGSADRIDARDAQRIQRALEIVLQSGKPVAEHNSNRKPALVNPLIKVALAYSDRSYLHQRIEQRFDLMLEQGLQNEVELLLSTGLSAEIPAMRMIGYRQMLEFLQGGITFNQMRLSGVAATRQLAKRQLTWLRHQSNVVWWVDLGLKHKNYDSLLRYIMQILQ